MKRIRSAQILTVMLLLALSSFHALADGGIIRLRETQGPFVVTIFTASEPVRNTPVDVSVLVQKADSSEAILDATVELALTAPTGMIMANSVDPLCGPADMVIPGQIPESRPTQLKVAATRNQASNKLLYAAPVKFDTAGIWRLQVIVARGNETAKVACDIPIESPKPQLAGLVPYLALPPLLVSLFALNQRLRKRPSVRTRHND
jgi:hypothetical protein